MAHYEVRDALQSLADANDGHLTPDAVVAAAASPTSPLHSHFVWDDTEAAALFRVQQARTLIRSVKIVFRTEERQITSVAYVRDPAQLWNEQGYVSVARLRDNREEARSAVLAEFARASAALARAQALAAALDLENEIGDLAGRVDALRVTVEASPANTAPV